MKKIVLLAFVLVVLSLALISKLPTPVEAHPANIIVPDDYERIQQAIGRARSGDTIFVRAGTYYENVIVNKRVSLIGENTFNTIIDGNFTGNVIKVTANNVTITGFTIQNSGSHPSCGIYVEEWSIGSNINRNIITHNKYGIYIHYNSKCNSISRNNITANKECGILLSEPSNNSISGNNITDNKYGIALSLSSDNIIYHNNFVDNTEQVLASKLDSTNVWDDGYPSGGSYWSGYTGVDVKSGPNQDQPSSDGIGDTPYVIDVNNQDRYPLMISSVPVEEVPEEKIPFWMQWWFWAIVVVGIVVSAGTVYLKKKKPPTPTAPTLPTEDMRAQIKFVEQPSIELN